MAFSSISKLWIGVILFIVCFKTGYSQINDTLLNYVIPNNQLKIGVSPTLYQGLKLTYEGEELLQSSLAPSIDIGIGYCQHIKSNWGVILELHWCIVPLKENFNVYIPDYYNKFQENFTHQGSDVATQIAYFPISLQKIFHLKKNHFFSLNTEIGTTINYVHPYEGRITVEYALDSTFSNSVEVFKMTLSNYQPWHIGYFAKIGLLKMTKKANSSFGLNFLVHYAPKPIGTGIYTFSNISSKSSGTVKLNLNYIGLEFVYGLTTSKKTVMLE